MIRRETSKQKLKNRTYESKREGRQADDGSPGALWENCCVLVAAPLICSDGADKSLSSQIHP